MVKQSDIFKKIISHSKEYGYIFQSSDLYDGLGAVYDYGPNGVELKNNIKDYWWSSMVKMHENIVGLDSAIFMHPKIWKASGHTDAFNDPLIDNKDSKKRYRADVLIEDFIEKIQSKNEKDIAKAKKEKAAQAKAEKEAEKKKEDAKKKAKPKKKSKPKKKKVKEELDNKDINKVKKLIRQVVADILRDLWIKRSVWKDK